MDKYTKANMVFSKFSRDYMELKKMLPIRPSEMGVLNIVTKRKGQYTPAMIAELLDVSKSMTAAHIASLEEKGYIYKDFSGSDKRSFYVMPTDKAKVLVAEEESKRNACLEAMESQLGEEAFAMLICLMEEAENILQKEKIYYGYS